MEWITNTIITLNPLSLGVIILSAMAVGWIFYGLRGYKYWFKRFHQYKVPRKRSLQKNYGYVEYVPEVVNVKPSPQPVAQPARIIEKNPAPQLVKKKSSVPNPSKDIPTLQVKQQEKLLEKKPIYSAKDDLRVVEGVGPKIEEILNTNGIYTWRELAATPIFNLENILERAGNRFKMHDPSSWPKQALMADTGKWDELRKWQDELHKGIEIKKD